MSLIKWIGIQILEGERGSLVTFKRRLACSW